MNGLSGLNKSPAEVVLGMVMVQLKLSNLVTTDDLAAQTQRKRIPTKFPFLHQSNHERSDRHSRQWNFDAGIET